MKTIKKIPVKGGKKADKTESRFPDKQTPVKKLVAPSKAARKAMKRGL
jgi:hypothetical protein